MVVLIFMLVLGVWYIVVVIVMLVVLWVLLIVLEELGGGKILFFLSKYCFCVNFSLLEFSMINLSFFVVFLLLVFLILVSYCFLSFLRLYLFFWLRSVLKVLLNMKRFLSYCCLGILFFIIWRLKLIMSVLVWFCGIWKGWRRMWWICSFERCWVFLRVNLRRCLLRRWRLWEFLVYKIFIFMLFFWFLIWYDLIGMLLWLR